MAPVKRHLERFGLKLPHSKSKDMRTHVDMSYCKEYRDIPPDTYSPDDPASYGPYTKNNRA